MEVRLFATCLGDLWRPQAVHATVAVLRRAGCRVDFDPRQTCCGQPAFNSGHRDEARRVAAHLLAVLGDDPRPLVAPSGSCAAMIRRHLSGLFPPPDPRHESARALAVRTWELSAFLVDVLGVDDLGASFRGRVLWHDACHGLRELGVRDQPRRLLHRVRGLDLLDWPEAELCCGFGGTFAVRHPELSVAMADHKLAGVAGLRPDAIASPDVSCLLQMSGRLARRGPRIPVLHLAEILASR